MQPLNYSLGLPDPSQAFTAGMQTAEQQRMIALARQREEMEYQRKVMADEAEAQRQLRLQQAVDGVRANPSADNYATLINLDPKNHEARKSAWTMLDKKQQEATTSDLLKWTAAIDSGKPKVAIQAMLARADLMEQQGGPSDESQALRARAAMVEQDPQAMARLDFEPMLMASPNGKDAIANLASFRAEKRTAELQPLKMRQEAADATTKEVAAKYADKQALIDLEAKGWNIKALQNDIEYKKQANRISAMNAQTSRTNSDLEREKLQIQVDDARGKLGDKVREKAAKAESAMFNTDNMLNTIERILAKPKVLASVVGTIQGRLPVVFSDESAAVVADIEQLGSQAFLSQIPLIKGTGQLSNAEGDKLQQGFQNFTRVRDEASMRATLDEGRRLLKKARASIAKEYGVPLGKPDTPAAPGSRPSLDSFFK